MKKIIIFGLPVMLVVSSCFFSYAQKKRNPQTVDYEITEDDPTRLAKLLVTLDYLYVNFGMSNIDGSSVDFGVNGTYRLSDKLEVSGLVHLPMFSFNKPAPFYTEAGGVLYFKEDIKKREVKVLLAYDFGSVLTSTGIYEYTSERYIMVPDRQVLRKFGVRGGLYLRKNSWENEDSNTTAVVQAGAYGGVQWFSAVNVRLNVNGRPARTEGGFMMYADLMLLPTSFASQALEDAYKDVEGSILPFGVRGGWMFRPVMPMKESTRKGFLTSMELRGEVGFRPVDGLFVNAGVGWNFIRF